MRLRWFAILACMLLLASMSMAITDLGGGSHRKPTMDNGTGNGQDDDVITCSTVFNRTCSNQICVSAGPNTCCGDCRNADGTHAPCNACQLN